MSHMPIRNKLYTNTGLRILFPAVNDKIIYDLSAIKS